MMDSLSRSMAVQQPHKQFSRTFLNQPAPNAIVQLQGISVGPCVQHGVHRSLQFKCQHLNNSVEPKVATAYNTIIGGNARALLSRNPICGPNQDLGPCANTFDSLAECACPELSRPLHPERRGQYDYKVVSTAMGYIQAQLSSFRLHMGVFATGRLFSEYALVIQLLDQLRHNPKPGKICLSLIDTEYQGPLMKFATVGTQGCFQDLSSGLPLNAALHGKALLDFTEKLTLSLPSYVQLELNVFASTDDYIAFCKQDYSYRNHLLIGSDMGDSSTIFENLRMNTQRQDGCAITLQKNQSSQVYLSSIPKAATRI